MDISTTAMLVKVTVSSWQGKAKSDKGSRELATAHNTSTERVSAYKNLVSKDKIDNILSKGNAIRTFTNEQTLPWENGGTRLLPAMNYMQFTTQLHSLINSFDMAADEFTAAYKGEIEIAKIKLNGLFLESDYPTDIRSKFGITVNFTPMSNASDFRVSIKSDEAERIKQEIERTSNERIQAAVTDLYDRIKTSVTRMKEALLKENGRFHESLIDNIRDLSEIVPRLNVTGDPQLNGLAQDIKALCVNVDSLKANPVQRQATAETAASILAKMGGMF